MCTGKVCVCNHTQSFSEHKAYAKLCSVCVCVYVYIFIYFFPLAQISAEEIKDTRVVYLEIEARNLDKKVLIDLFLMILHASVGFASKKAVTVKIVSLTVL